jgi:ribosomal protein S18 acetylase RimI-like enzyme
MGATDIRRQPAAIERAGLRDFRIIDRLVKECFGRDAWTWLDILEALALPGTIRLKAVAGDEVLGYVIGDRRSSRVGWIASIGVRVRARRRGVGRQLLLAAEQALGTPLVRLTLRPSNQAALGLYQQLGYYQVDMWKRYYRDGEDGLVMERKAGPHQM